MLDVAREVTLKFRLLADGVFVDQDARDAWAERYAGPLTLSEYATTSGVALVLPGDLYVNAPLVEDRSTPTLHFSHGEFVIDDSGVEIPVDVVPVPARSSEVQIDKLDGKVRPNSSYGVTHTDRCRVSPIAGCAWKCKFCDLPYEFTYRKRHQENLLEVIRAATDDPVVAARHVLVSGGTPRRGPVGNSDEEWLDSVYEYLALHSPLPLDVMMAPRRDLSHPEWMRSINVNMLSLNLEVSDPERARSIAPAKSTLGRRHCLDYIERAVESFGVGQVQSLLVFGASIEDRGSTLKGVRDLVERGCLPVLSPFRPHPLTPLGHLPGATLEEMLDIWLATVEICEKVDNGVKPGPRCIPCHHNTLTVPDESDFYLGMSDDPTKRCAVC